MKKLFFVFGILLIVFLVSGQGCDRSNAADSKSKIKSVDSEGGFIDGVEDVIVEGEEGKVLVDRTRYVQGGNPPHDFTSVIFFQETGKGYKIKVDSDQKVKVELMDDKNCVLRGQGDEYSVIDEKKGSDVIIAGRKLEGDGRSLCVGVTALGDGNTEINFLITELV